MYWQPYDIQRRRVRIARVVSPLLEPSDQASSAAAPIAVEHEGLLFRQRRALVEFELLDRRPLLLNPRFRGSVMSGGQAGRDARPT